MAQPNPRLKKNTDLPWAFETTCRAACPFLILNTSVSTPDGLRILMA